MKCSKRMLVTSIALLTLHNPVFAHTAGPNPNSRSNNLPDATLTRSRI